VAEIQERKKVLGAELDEVQQQIEAVETKVSKGAEAVTEAVTSGDEDAVVETIDALEAEVSKIADELSALTAEEDQLREQQEGLRNRAPGNVRSRDGGTERERRGRELKQQRAVNVAGGTLVKPVAAGVDVNGLIGSGISSIVDLVKMADRVGMSEYQVPYQTATSAASKTTEGSEVAESDVTFDYASIKPTTVAIYSEISREVLKLNNTAYYDVVVEAAKRALRKKIAEYIIKSDATTSPTFVGILAAKAITSTTDMAITKIDEGTLRKIAFAYGGDDDIIGDAVLFLTKKDLVSFGDVRGTSEKKAVYEITPDTANTNTGIIKDGGLAVRYCLNNNLAALADASANGYTMVYGAPSCYECGVFSDFTVRVSEEAAFRRRMIAVLGEVMIGGNVTVKDGFVRVKKGASA
jgi:HK97 family phage major capsid protein